VRSPPFTAILVNDDRLTAAGTTTDTASMSSLFVAVVGLFLVVAHGVDVFGVANSPADARRLLRLSLEIARSLEVLRCKFS